MCCSGCRFSRSSRDWGNACPGCLHDAMPKLVEGYRENEKFHCNQRGVPLHRPCGTNLRDQHRCQLTLCREEHCKYCGFCQNPRENGGDGHCERCGSCQNKNCGEVHCRDCGVCNIVELLHCDDCDLYTCFSCMMKHFLEGPFDNNAELACEVCIKMAAPILVRVMRSTRTGHGICNARAVSILSNRCQLRNDCYDSEVVVRRFERLSLLFAELSSGPRSPPQHLNNGERRMSYRA